MPLDVLPVFSILDRITDADGAPVSGGYAEFYDAGTTTPRTVYSDSGLTVSLGTVVYADTGGYPVSTHGGSTKVSVYTGTGAFKVVVKDSAGTTLIARDNIPGALDTSAFAPESATPDTPVLSKTAAYSVVVGDAGKLINANCTGGSFVITLPSAVTAGDGFRIGIRHAGTANTVTISTVSSQTIAQPGPATQNLSLTGRGETYWLVSDGANWTIDTAVPSLMRNGVPFITIADRLSSPPSSPTAGARYIVGSSPTGAWSTLSFSEHDVAEADGNGSWIKYTPAAGWRGYVIDEDLDVRFSGTAWVDLDNMTAPDTSALEEALFYDQRADGTVGGTATTGAWTTATIQTTKTNTITDCSLASNAISLPVGSYDVTAKKFISAGNTQSIRLKLANGGSPIYFEGINNPLAGAEKVTLHADAAFTLTAPDTLTLEYYAQSSTDTGDLGEPLTIAGNLETYASIKILKRDAKQGSRGEQGIQGTDGIDAGYAYQWSTSTSGDPGSGKIAGNNATIASITQLAVSETDRVGNPMAAILATWDDSTSSDKAVVTIKKESAAASTDLHEFKITGAGTDAGSYWTFPVTYVATNGTISNGNDVAVQPVRVGYKGDAGPTGPTGATGPTGPAGGSGIATVVDHGAVGNGTTDDRAAIATADAAGDVIFPRRTYRVSSNITLSNAAVFLPGAKLSIDSGVVVTFGKPISAGMEQIFTGSGTVAFTRSQDARAEWWGAIADNSTACRAAIQAADDALALGSRILLAEGTYSVDTTTITLTTASVIGTGRKTILRPSASAAVPVFTIAADSIGIEHVSILGDHLTTPTNRGIQVGTASAQAGNAKVADIFIYGFTSGVGMRCMNGNAMTFTDIRIQQCLYCIYSGGVAATYFGDCHWHNVLCNPVSGGIGVWDDNGTNAQYRTDFSILGGTVGYQASSSAAEAGSWIRPSNIWFWDSNISANAAAGVYLVKCYEVEFFDTSINGTTAGSGVLLSAASSSDVEGVAFFDCSIAGNATHGISWVKARNVRLVGGKIMGNSVYVANTYDGVSIGASAEGLFEMVGVLAGLSASTESGWGNNRNLQRYAVDVNASAFTDNAGGGAILPALGRVNIASCMLAGNATGAINGLTATGIGAQTFASGRVRVAANLGVSSYVGAIEGVTSITLGANDAGALGASGTAFSDLFLASGGVINWNSGDVTITHSTNALAFAGASSGYSFDAPLTLTGGTITTSAPIVSATQTWNAAGVTFTGFKINVTDTASAAASLLADLQIGGTTMFSVAKSGVTTVAATKTFTKSTTTLQISDSSAGYTFVSAYGLKGSGDDAGIGDFALQEPTTSKAARVTITTDVFLAWRSSGVSSGTMLTGLISNAADILQQRRSTNAQTFQVYGTFTDTSNYERTSLRHVTGTGAEILAETAGTGADDLDVKLTPAGVGKVRFGTHSALAAETVTGYITIKDAGGTSRKIAVVS